MIRNILINSIVSFGLIIGAMTGLSHAGWHTYIEEYQEQGPEACNAVYVQTWDVAGDRYSYMDRVDMSAFEAGRDIISFQIIVTITPLADFTGTITVGRYDVAICNQGAWCDIDYEYSQTSKTGTFLAGQDVTFTHGSVIDSFNSGVQEWPSPSYYTETTAFMDYSTIPVSFEHRIDMVRVNDESNAGAIYTCAQ